MSAAALDDPGSGWRGQAGADGADPVVLDQHVGGSGHRVGGRGVVDEHVAEQHGHGPSRSRQAGHGGKGVGARGVQAHRHQAGRDADARGDAVDDRHAQRVASAGRRGRPGRRSRARRPRPGRVDRRRAASANASSRWVEPSTSSATGTSTAITLQRCSSPSARTTRSLWAMVRAGSVMTTNRCATRHAVCSAASVIPTTGQVATSRAAATPVSPKQAMTNASVSAWCCTDLLDHSDGGDRLLGMAFDAGHADRGVDAGDRHAGARDRLCRRGDGGRQLGGGVRVDHGDPGHRATSRVTAASSPSMPGPPTAMRAAAHRRGRGVRVAAAQMLGGERPAERVAGAGAVDRFDDIGWHRGRFGVARGSPPGSRPRRA